MNYSKLTITLFFSLLSINSYADGCQSLQNSNWMGQLQVKKGTPITLRMHIEKVIQVSEESFTLIGTVNNEKLATSVGCVEQRLGNIRSILIGSKNMQLSSHAFIPDHHNPVMMYGVTGKYDGVVLDGDANSSLNYFSRS